MPGECATKAGAVPLVRSGDFLLIRVLELFVDNL
jgi:hypothetical protein